VAEALDEGRIYMENYVEGEEVPNGSSLEKRHKEEFKEQLASLNIKEAPVIGSFDPKKVDIVLA
ncbi:hypothetical protein Tco_0304464, partial [Tanacetum coccineum]